MPMFKCTVLLAVIFGIGCRSDGSGPDQSVRVATLEKVEGDQQSWYFDNPLPKQYAVSAFDQDGQPVAGAEVSWTVVSGNGSVDPTRGTTDAEGIARATHTLGPGGAAQSVQATAAGTPVVLFTSTGTSAPTEVVVTVGNNFFSPRDVVVKLGGTVTWIWESDPVPHNVTYTAGPSPLPPSSSTQVTGSFVTTFTSTSLFDYVCTLHAGMEGTVRVVR